MTLHLVDGESIDVCHVIGLSEAWAAIAAHDPGISTAAARPPMRTVLVPYETILRVTLREQTPDGTRIGFRQDRPPEMFASEPLDRAVAERALALVAREAPSGESSARLGNPQIPSQRGGATLAMRPRGSRRSRSGDTHTRSGASS